AVQLSIQHAADTRWRPSPRPTGTRARTRLAFCVQELGDRLQSLSFGSQGEHAPDDRRFRRLDHAFDMRTQRTTMLVRTLEHVVVPIAEDARAGDVPSRGETLVSLPHAFARLLSVCFIGKGFDRHDRLVE